MPAYFMVPMTSALSLEAVFARVICWQIRKALKELIDEVDPDIFWQIHRGALVRATAIDSVQRDEAGRQTLHLKGYPQALTVSRMNSHLFKAM